MRRTDMGQTADSWAERRSAMRVPVQGSAVLRSDAARVHGVVENLSCSGALLHVSTLPGSGEVELELHLADGNGTLRARMVRVSPTRHATWFVALAFDRIDPPLQRTIDTSIADAMQAARARTVLVLDNRDLRRAQLLDRLVDRGFTPVAPRTPLETIDLLASAALHVRMCLVAKDFAVARNELAQTLGEHFPWVTVAEISDDLELTVDNALAAYARSVPRA
ncbi:MAG: PilZ domain-containing protein [Kofleriaceae bacterium]|nr:PilZ domain-containing protein [Kofleriaceae bacterium]